MELPILSTLHSGIPEAVENNVNGLLSREGDAIGFYKNMEKIITWKYLNQNRQKVRETIFTASLNFLGKRYGNITKIIFPYK